MPREIGLPNNKAKALRSTTSATRPAKRCLDQLMCFICRVTPLHPSCVSGQRYQHAMQRQHCQVLQPGPTIHQAYTSLDKIQYDLFAIGTHVHYSDRRPVACFRWEEGNAYDVEITDYHS